MQQSFDFEEIRPLYDEEIQDILPSIVNNPAFQPFLKYIDTDLSEEAIKEELLGIKSKKEFQTKISAPSLFKLAENTATSLNLKGTELVSKDKSYTYVSNHRDIILDASFLNIQLHREGFETCEVAIGDNLLIYPWIKELVRLNKSFIVKRNVPIRQMLEISRRLSYYIHFALKIKGESVWIAQREGRSKDWTDKTQESMLKMLAMGGGKDIVSSLRSMNITPVAISYEYDPCDYLKAKEFQMKRDNPEHKKSMHDDLINMQTGLLGFKGNIMFQITPTINEKIDKIQSDLDKSEKVIAIAKIIDNQIHSNMTIYPCNYIAYDIVYKTNKYQDKYNEDQKKAFLDYVNRQLAKVDLENRDDEFLSGKIFEMYSNTVLNYENAIKEI